LGRKKRRPGRNASRRSAGEINPILIFDHVLHLCPS